MSAAIPFTVLVLRHMNRTDVQAVAAIEQAAYEFPWTPGIFRDCIRVGYHCRVATVEGGVRAYGIMSTAAGEAHILNLCVDPDTRRSGLGRSVLGHLTELAVRAQSQRMYLEVRPSNVAAQALYASAGFVQIGRRKAYYRARVGREDAVVLALELARPG